jgi:hypothetical protein
MEEKLPTLMLPSIGITFIYQWLYITRICDTYKVTGQKLFNFFQKLDTSSRHLSLQESPGSYSALSTLDVFLWKGWERR